jgi:hypothetical protein
MFFCWWSDRAPLVVDAPSEAAARKIASEVGEDAPEVVRAIDTNVFVGEVVFDDETGGVTIEPLEHVEDLLVELHDLAEEGLASGGTAQVVCSSEGETDAGAVVRCTMTDGHEGDHTDGSVVWA